MKYSTHAAAAGWLAAPSFPYVVLWPYRHLLASPPPRTDQRLLHLRIGSDRRRFVVKLVVVSSTFSVGPPNSLPSPTNINCLARVYGPTRMRVAASSFSVLCGSARRLLLLLPFPICIYMAWPTSSFSSIVAGLLYGRHHHHQSSGWTHASVGDIGR